MMFPLFGMDITIPGNGGRGNRYSANGGKVPVNGEKKLTASLA
jgi:hypothetical protein